MKNVIVPSPARSLDYVLGKLRVALTTKLNIYCNNKLINLGVYTKTTVLTLVNESNSYGNIQIKLGMSKLRTYLTKFLLKNTPHLSFATESFFKKGTGSDPFVTLTVVSPTFNRPPSFLKLTDYDVMISGVHRERVALEYFQKSGVSRYIRYLNYMFRKYRVPLQATSNSVLADTSKETGNMHTRLQGVTREEQNLIRKEKIPVTVLTYVDISKYQWIPHHTNVESMEEMSDSTFANPARWVETVFEEGTTRIDINNSKYPYANIFKYFKYGIQIVTTLSRKTYYGPEAYSFRSV